MFHHHASSPCLKKICCYCVFQCICFHLQAIATQLYHNQAHIFLSFASTHNTLQCLGYFDPWQPYQGRLVTNWISSWKKEENEPKLLHCCDVHWICKINKTFGHFLWRPDALLSRSTDVYQEQKNPLHCVYLLMCMYPIDCIDRDNAGKNEKTTMVTCAFYSSPLCVTFSKIEQPSNEAALLSLLPSHLSYIL